MLSSRGDAWDKGCISPTLYERGVERRRRCEARDGEGMHEVSKMCGGVEVRSSTSGRGNNDIALQELCNIEESTKEEKDVFR